MPKVQTQFELTLLIIISNQLFSEFGGALSELFFTIGGEVGRRTEAVFLDDCAE